MAIICFDVSKGKQKQDVCIHATSNKERKKEKICVATYNLHQSIPRSDHSYNLRTDSDSSILELTDMIVAIVSEIRWHNS